MERILSEHDDFDITGYENLANAIIKKAVSDYIQLATKVHNLLKKPHRSEGVQTLITGNISSLNSIEKFFFSRSYELYTSVSPDYLLEQVFKKIEEKIGTDGVAELINAGAGEYLRKGVRNKYVS